MLITLFLLVLPIIGTVDSKLDEANAKLLQGEKATAYDERMLALNRALYLYNQMQVESSSPAFNRVIGDLYYQLEEYPWAVLYYHKTLKAEPHDLSALAHLHMAQEKLGIIDSEALPKAQNHLVKLFSALATQRHLYLWVLLFTFLIFSLCLWFPYRILRKIAGCSALILLLLLINGAIFYYSTPLDGILIAPTGFYRVPDRNQAQMTTVPLFAGSKVTILQISANGEWLKITNASGLVGFIPASSLRLI